MTTRPLLPSLLLVSALIAAACGRRSGSGLGDLIESPGAPPPAAGAGTASGFEGIARLSPLDDGFVASWNPVRDDDGSASADYAYRVYAAFDGAAIDYSNPSQVTGPGESQVAIDGLAPGTRVAVTVQADSQVDAADLDRNEVVLEGIVARRWFVRSSASPGGDGATPATAFATIAEAIQAVVDSAAAGNVLIAAGGYGEDLVLPGDVHLHGSWDDAFTASDPSAHPTTLRPTGLDSTGVRIDHAPGPTFVDGLDVDGGGLVSRAVSVKNSDLQWSNSTITSFVNEGLECRSKERRSLLRIRNTSFVACATEGLEATGALDAELTSCSFRENGAEGAEFDNLSVLPAGTSTLWVRDCRFERNGNDGLDVDLNELLPTTGGSSLGGRIEVLVERCLAADNDHRGFLIDVDYEDVDEITSAVVLSGNEAVRQGEDGCRIDADAAAHFVLTGNRSSASGTAGLSVGGASPDALVIVSNHWSIGSGGDGVAVVGIAPAILTHAGVTGTSGASVLGNCATVLVNCAIWLSGAPTGADVSFTYSDLAIAGTGNFSGDPQVRIAPAQLFTLDAPGADRDRFTLPAGESLFAGDWIEIGDDSVARQVTQVLGGEATFAPPADAPPATGDLVARFESADVAEDPRLVSNSPWQDAGDPLQSDGDATVTDVGVLGGMLESFLPLRSTGWVPFVANRLTPPPGIAPGPLSQVRLGFSRALDESSVDGSTFVVLVDGQPASGAIDADADQLDYTFDSPVGGGTVEVQVHGGVRSSSGEELLLPLRYRIVIQ